MQCWVGRACSERVRFLGTERGWRRFGLCGRRRSGSRERRGLGVGGASRSCCLCRSVHSLCSLFSLGPEGIRGNQRLSTL